MNLISLLFSSISPVLNKFSLVSLNAVVGGVLTSTFAAAFNLILIMVTYKKVSIVKDKMVIILGATNAIGVLLQYIALSMLSPVTVTLIARIYLVYVFLLGGIFLKERIRGWDYVAIAACIAGSILVSSGRAQFDSWLGILCAFIYPFMYAANNVIAKYLVQDDHPADVLFFNHLVSALLLLVAGFLIPHTYTSLKYITAGKANIVRALGPLIVIVYSYFFFPITINAQIICGALLLILATTIVTVKQAQVNE
ncbi:DMT family transporter [Limosilactobacillus fermentum]|uniref:DMT family transporter n=1 Tax=Limosilactobacillus fermentum TaxID=1613 RepID=UPI00292CDA36|nr:EamA family transporter [Limosilactobacillus fermentum]WNY94190.1 EamA family transporter [Limosilactobacillus fermentum]